MKSRKKRKRDRRRAEATVCQPRFKRGFGVGLPTKRSDSLIIRKSFREDWHTDEDAKKRAVQELCETAARSQHLRVLLSALNTLCVGSDADLRRLIRGRAASESSVQSQED